MGWTSGWHTKEEMVNYCNGISLFETAETEYGLIDTRLIGGNLWQLRVKKDVATRTSIIFIGLCRIEAFRGDWGYKGMDETCGPHYYDCPLSFLDQCTGPINEYALNWREECRIWHKTRAERRKAARNKIAPGTRFTLPAGYPDAADIFLVTYWDGKLKRAQNERTGVIYRVTPKHIGEIVAA